MCGVVLSCQIGENENAFSDIYTSVLLALFSYWQRHNCQYMQFGPVLEVMRNKLIRALLTRPESMVELQQTLRLDYAKE